MRLVYWARYFLPCYPTRCKCHRQLRQSFHSVLLDVSKKGSHAVTLPSKVAYSASTKYFNLYDHFRSKLAFVNFRDYILQKLPSFGSGKVVKHPPAQRSILKFLRLPGTKPTFKVNVKKSTKNRKSHRWALQKSLLKERERRVNKHEKHVSRRREKVLKVRKNILFRISMVSLK